ncbi:MAG: DUF465 domain-containing protein [Pseudomonadota bacterium]
MVQDARLQALYERHNVLEQELEVEQQRPLPDDNVIIQLKRRKLDLKDEIQKLEAS